MATSSLDRKENDFYDVKLFFSFKIPIQLNTTNCIDYSGHQLTADFCLCLDLKLKACRDINMRHHQFISDIYIIDALNNKYDQAKSNVANIGNLRLCV